MVSFVAQYVVLLPAACGLSDHCLAAETARKSPPPLNVAWIAKADSGQQLRRPKFSTDWWLKMDQDKRGTRFHRATPKTERVDGEAL